MMHQWTPLLPSAAIETAHTLLHRADALREKGVTIYPPREKTFAALALTPPQAVKVVILGQDPYHGAGQANGLAFSVEPFVAIPPSLRNIYKELTADLSVPMPTSGDLTPWAREGVLLLNTSLTVEAGKANSHKDWGWDKVISAICTAVLSLPQPVVFLLWGRSAHKFLPQLAIEQHPHKKALLSSHPSPLGATKAIGNGIIPFLGSRPYSSSNALLEAFHQKPVNWHLP